MSSQYSSPRITAHSNCAHLVQNFRAARAARRARPAEHDDIADQLAGAISTADSQRELTGAQRSAIYHLDQELTGKVSTDQQPADTARAQGRPSFSSCDERGTLVKGTLPLPLQTTEDAAERSDAKDDHQHTLSPVADTPPSSPLSPTDAARAASARYPRRKNRRLVPRSVRLVAWKRLTQEEKDARLDMEAERRGALSISLHVSHEVAALLREVARSGRNLPQVIADRIVRQFRKAGVEPPLLSFEIETAPDGAHRLHIQGIALFETSPVIDRAQVRQLFRDGLGFIEGKSGSTQFWSREFYDVGGQWRSYNSKHKDRIAQELGTDRLSYTSRRLEQLAREAHEQEREAARTSYPRITTGTLVKAC